MDQRKGRLMHVQVVWEWQGYGPRSWLRCVANRFVRTTSAGGDGRPKSRIADISPFESHLD